MENELTDAEVDRIVWGDEPPKHLDNGTYIKETKRTYDDIVKGIFTGRDIMDLPLDEDNYLIEKFLWKGSVGYVVGAEKACKSIFTAQQCLAMTCGEPFLGMFDVAEPLNILYVQAEGTMYETYNRIKKATQDHGCMWDQDKWHHHFPPYLRLHVDGDVNTSGGFPEGTYNHFESMVMEMNKKIDVVIFDSLYMCIKGANLRGEEDINSFHGNVRRFCQKFKCSAIINHHEHRQKTDQFGKRIEEGDNSIYGSAFIKAFATSIIRIAICDKKGKAIMPEQEEEGKDKYRRITCATQRNENIVKKQIMKLKQEPLMFEVVDSNHTSAKEDIVYRHIKNGASCATMIHKETDLNDSTIRTCIKRLKDKNLIEKCGTGKYGAAMYKTTGLTKE